MGHGAGKGPGMAQGRANGLVNKAGNRAKKVGKYRKARPIPVIGTQHQFLGSED